MQLAAAAYPIDWHNRWNEYVGKLRVWVRTAAEAGARLLVFPEFAALEIATLAGEANAADPARAVDALTARLRDVDELHASLAREFGVHICAASGPVRERDGRVFNRARLFAPSGGRGAQDQLAPPAELRGVWGVEPGGAARVFDTALGRVGVLIGADLATPDAAAAMAIAGAEMLLAPGRSADAEAAATLRAAAVARARETGCVVVQAVALGAANWSASLGRSTGAAAVLTPRGGELPESGALAEGKPDAPGWVQGDTPGMALAAARRAAAPIDDPGIAVEVLSLAPPPGQ